MKATKKLLGARIKELRNKKGLSQNDLSERVGIDPKHLSRLEVGGSYPSFETVNGIAESLDVSLKELFQFTPEGTDREIIENIRSLLKEANSAELRLIYKLVIAVVR